MASKIIDSERLTSILTWINLKFSKIGHSHTKSDITDFPTIPSTDDCVKKNAGQQVITSSSDTPLKLKSTNDNGEAWIGVTNKNDLSRYFGTDANGKPLFYNGSNRELALKTDIPSITVSSGDSGTSYTIKVSSSAPASGTANTVITLVK